MDLVNLVVVVRHLIKRPLVEISGHNSNPHSSNMTALNKFFLFNQLRKLLADALIVTEAIYVLRESYIFLRTFETDLDSNSRRNIRKGHFESHPRSLAYLEPLYIYVDQS